MKPSEVFSQHRETIRYLVEQSIMTNPRVFGSTLHGDDIDGSDLDLLVDAPPNASLFDLVRLEGAIESVVNVKVDLLTPKFLSPKFRDKVLAEAQPI